MNSLQLPKVKTMLFQIGSYLLFLINSTNAHGIHSPFVFNYVTKCLYQKANKRVAKTKTVIFKSIDYFKAKNVMTLADKQLKIALEKAYPTIQYDTLPIDLLFIQDATDFDLSAYLGQNKLHNDSVIILDAIYQNAAHSKQWRALCKRPEITVSIDHYHCGVLLLRKEQAKEHFTIRI